MYVIDLFYFVKIYCLKNKCIFVNFLCYFYCLGDLYLLGIICCIYEDVIMKKCFILLIVIVLSGIFFMVYVV